MKPALEPICLARKPLDGTIAENVLAHGTGALNIDGCRVGISKNVPASASKTPNNIYGAGMTSLTGGTNSSGFDPNVGRWPANVVHDGSDEVTEAFPDTAPATFGRPRVGKNGDGWGMTATGAEYDDDGGSAARFFYTSKADADDRLGSRHPTVKPLDLIQYLVRLITPPGGTVLDPFAGTGTTAEAALREGARAILIEREAAYCEDIRRRMKLWLAGPDERAHASIKARGLVESPGPLFDGWEEAAE